MVDSLYLIRDRSRYLIVSTYKRFFFIDVKTLRCLSRYIFRERKYKSCKEIIEREMLSNMHAVENIKYKSLF